MAKCINRPQYAKVIDKGVNTPMNGLFIPGSPYYTKTAYPSYDPAGAATLVKKVAQETGKPVSFSLASTSDPETLRAAQFLQQAFQTAGMQVNINIIAQATHHQQRVWPAPTRPRCGASSAAVDPDLNYVWLTTQLASGSLALNMARNVDPRIQAALLAGRTTNDKAARAKRTSRSTSTWPQDIPYLWLARDTWAVIANPKVQNFANPMTLSGFQGRRLRRGRALADADLG